VVDNVHNCVSKFIWYFGLQVIVNIQLLVTVVIIWLYSRQTCTIFIMYIVNRLFVLCTEVKRRDNSLPYYFKIPKTVGFLAADLPFCSALLVSRYQCTEYCRFSVMTLGT